MEGNVLVWNHNIPVFRNSMRTSEQLSEHLQNQTVSNIPTDCPQNILWMNTVTLYVGGEWNWMERDTQLCTCALGCNIQTWCSLSTPSLHILQANIVTPSIIFTLKKSFISVTALSLILSVAQQYHCEHSYVLYAHVFFIVILPIQAK